MCDHRRLGRAGRADRSAEPDGRPHVRAERGHGRVHRPRRHAAGHVARGHDRDRAATWSRRSAQLEGVSHVAYLAGADRYNHFHLLFYLLPVERADRHAGARWSRRCASVLAQPSGVRRRSSSAAESARRRRQRSRIQAVLLGPDIDKLYDYSQQIAREGASDAEPRRREDRLQRRQPRSARRRGSGARRRPRRPHGDGRQHAAADGGRRRRDLDAIAKPANSIR